MSKTRNFASIIRARLREVPVLAEAVADEHLNASVAMQIYEARGAAGLTQKQLADRAGTTQSVIARMEDSDYSGHSLTMLRKLATALGCNVGVEFYAKPQFVTRSVATAEISFVVEGCADDGGQEATFEFVDSNQGGTQAD